MGGGEIETALVQCLGIRDAIVVAQEEPTGEKRLIGYVIFAAIPTSSRADLQRQLRSKLPDAMIPSDFVFLDALPLTPNGKVDRRGTAGAAKVGRGHRRSDQQAADVSRRKPGRYVGAAPRSSLRRRS